MRTLTRSLAPHTRELQVCVGYSAADPHPSAPAPASTPRPRSLPSPLLQIRHDIPLQDLKRLLRAERLEGAQVVWVEVREDGRVEDEGVLVQDDRLRL